MLHEGSIDCGNFHSMHERRPGQWMHSNDCSMQLVAVMQQEAKVYALTYQATAPPEQSGYTIKLLTYISKTTHVDPAVFDFNYDAGDEAVQAANLAAVAMQALSLPLLLQHTTDICSWDNVNGQVLHESFTYSVTS